MNQLLKKSLFLFGCCILSGSENKKIKKFVNTSYIYYECIKKNKEGGQEIMITSYDFKRDTYYGVRLQYDDCHKVYYTCDPKDDALVAKPDELYQLIEKEYLKNDSLHSDW